MATEIGREIIERLAEFEPPIETNAKLLNLTFLDANPLYSSDKKTLPKNWKSAQLIDAKTSRKGTSADGVSQLILRAEVSEDVPFTFKLASKNDGKIEPLLGGKTVAKEGILAGKTYYAFALYTPPDVFDIKSKATSEEKSPLKPPKERLNEILEKRDITVTITPKGGRAASKKFMLARPPVVLVHGLFSDPVETWIKTSDKGASMAALLERAGFLPFLVNYQNTNGMELTKRSWMGAEKVSFKPSSFEDNKAVVWDSPLVDYTPFKYEYGYFKEEAILSELQKPQNTRIGGIKQALKYYRDDLQLAATQAIVVGHSMGGLLARVWASKRYNPTYERPENFGKGDINRLLTLNTPHFGSELVELKDAIGKTHINKESWVGWGRRKIANTVVSWYLDPEPEAMRDLRPGSAALLKIGETKIPSYAISTSASSAEMGDKENDPLKAYQALYSFAGMLFFNNRPLLDDFVETRFKQWSQGNAGESRTRSYSGKKGENNNSAGTHSVLDISDEGNRDKYKKAITDAIDHNVYFWAARRSDDYQNDLRATLKNARVLPYGTFSSNMGRGEQKDPSSSEILLSKVITGGDVSREFDDNKVSDTPEIFLSILRDLIFHQDPNTDGTVRVVSQSGGIDKKAQANIERVLHSYSPWSYKVQREVLFLLKKDFDKFSESGFPAAGKIAARYMPSTALIKPRVTGQEAITWSGMVPSHAREYLRIADQNNVFILARPVNSSSTQLLANCERSLNRMEFCAAAKGMNVKGKSSSWGPQVGYIPADQRYSKLWRMVKNPELLKNQIKKYNEEVEKSLTKKHPEKAGRTYAVERPLTVHSEHSATKGSCAVLTDPGVQDAEQAVFLYCADKKVYRWQNGTKNGSDSFDSNAPLQPANIDEAQTQKLLTKPMMVLADDTSDLDIGLGRDAKDNLIRPYLTADYDLLAIGFPYESAQCSGRACQPQPTEGVKKTKFDKLRGFISPKQSSLVAKLNKAVEARAHYEGGFVTHHGPENQYPASPYVDYPILVFDPGEDEKASAYLIRQGPPGFRDVHLKRFFTTANQSGYNLWPNLKSDAWQWGNFNPTTGYNPRDASNLPPYVKEVPRPAGEPAFQKPAAGKKVEAEEAKKQSVVKQIITSSKQDPSRPSAKEAELWKSVNYLPSKDAVEAYLYKYPNGFYARKAKSMMVNLQAVKHQQEQGSRPVSASQSKASKPASSLALAQEKPHKSSEEKRIAQLRAEIRREEKALNRKKLERRKLDQEIKRKQKLASLTPRSQPKTKQVRSGPKVFNLYNNYDLQGRAYKSIRNTGERKCRSICRSQKGCVAYTYDKWNDWCHLKNRGTTLVFLPKANTGFMKGIVQPNAHPSPVTIKHYRKKQFPGHNYRVLRDTSFEACERACLNDRVCVAFTFVRRVRKCGMKNIAAEYHSDKYVDSGVKIQLTK